MKATLAIQSAFKQNTDELANSINFLNAVENQTSTTLNDLVEAIPKAGPVIKGLGGSIQDLALYLTAMREGGINASEGANALKSALASLINPTDVAVRKFEGFGIDLLGIVSKNAGNVTGTLLALQDSLDRLNPLQKQQAIEQLFGKFQFSRLNALFENLGRQGSQTLQVLDLMKASTSDLAEVAGRELTQVTESASGKYRRALESLKADLAGVGEQFLTIGTKIITIVDKALEFFNGLPKPIKSALTFLGALTAVAGPLIMLTGVLANFFGYILKGVMHMKAFFKGGEGWRYLTPEMLAAEKAGKLVEQTFYSDAKAASILQLALKNLIDEFSILEAKAKSGNISVNPAVSTMAGNMIMGAGGRVVNPQHPLAGAMGTRASTHMVPRASLTEEQRMSQTIFGLVPGAIPVNRKIGDAPQIYMNDPLPPVPGLTTIGGVSTGVVSGEAARWHAMMGTLAMQSKAEIEALKKQIATTGVVSKDFMNQFDDILPIVSGITDNAAKQSALIVAELRAGKLTVEQARQQIIALNLEIERMITSAVGQQAAAMGRTINPTMVPTLNQPVVDPTGKSNMRELFKKSKTRDLIDKISRSLGVRTSGAGYNIETTRPKKFNMGGQVYLNQGNVVPGQGNTDTVPAMLTPGEFVVNKEATAANLPLLQAINNSTNGGQATFGRGNYGRTGPTGYSSSDIDDLYDYLNYLTDGDSYDVTFRQNAILNDATALLDSGKVRDVDTAISMATKDVDNALKYANGDEVKYRQAREVQAAARGLNTGRVGRRQNVNAVNRTEIAEAMRKRGHTRVMDFAHRAHIDPISYTETNRGYYGQAVHDRWNSFSNTLRQRIPEIEDRVPITSAGASARADYIARHLGFENHDDMIIREQEVRQIATTGRAPRGRPAPLGIFRFLRHQLPQAAVAVAGRGRIRMRNSGGMIPGYNRGGLVGYVRGSKKPVGEAGDGGVPMGGGMGMMFAGMGLQMAGQTVGGTTGQIMSSAGMAANLMMMLQMIPKVNMAMSKLNGTMGPFSAGAKKASESLAGKAKNLTGLSRAFGPVLRGLSFLVRGFGPLGLAVTGTILAVKGLTKLYKDHQETLRLNRLEYGMSAEALKKAGYTMTDYNGQVKKGIEDAKALQERNKMLYESMFQAGIPIKMTIAEYKKLRAETKEKMPDLIELFNQKSNSEINTTASRLKAQFMSMGDSIETATAKVYALMSQSNKAQFAAAAIGSKGFRSIRDEVDAAVYSAGTFDDALKKGDAKAASDALLVTFEGIGNAIEANAKKNKIEFAASMDQVLKKMATTGKGQVAINQSVLAELKKQNPELAKILNSTDTATSAWAKYQLALKGVNLDLQNLSGQAATAALRLQEMVTANATTTLKGTAGIKDQYAAYDNLQKRIKSLQSAAKGQSVQEQIDTRKVIEGLNARIKKIKEAADAKIKALRAQSQAENDQLELQKLQLEYQEAVARGDQDAAARAQIALQQFTNQVQSKKAEESIIAKAELEIKPLQDQIDALNNKNKELADKAALAGESLSKLQEKAGALRDKLSGLEKALSSAVFNKLIMGDTYEGSEQQKADLAAVETGRRDLGMSKSVVTVTGRSHPKSTVTSRTTVLDTPGGAKDLTSKIVQTMSVQAQVVNLVGNIKSGGAAPAGGYTRDMPKKIDPNTSYKTNDKGLLDDNAKRSILMANPELGNGSFFEYNGRKYKVNSVVRSNYQGIPYIQSMDVVAQKSLGGRITAGRKYMFNDRIGPLGAQQEGFLPDIGTAAMSGFIYPNINTMPKYNIPSNTISGVNSGANNSYSNNVYNIDIALNGTNVTADDVMRKFEEKMSSINARQGRSITVKPVNKASVGSR